MFVPTLQESYARCRELNRCNGIMYYWFMMVLVKDKRFYVHALYAFCCYVDDIVAVGVGFQHVEIIVQVDVGAICFGVYCFEGDDVGGEVFVDFAGVEVGIGGQLNGVVGDGDVGVVEEQFVGGSVIASVELFEAVVVVGMEYGAEYGWIEVVVGWYFQFCAWMLGLC